MKRVMRFLCVVTAAVLLAAMMPGARVSAVTVEDMPVREHRPNLEGWSYVQPRTESEYVNEWEAAQQLTAALESWPEEYTLHVGTTYTDYEQLIYDLYYVATDHTGIPTQGDYQFYQIYDFGYGLGGYSYGSYAKLDITYYFSYLTDADEQAQVDVAVANILSQLDTQGKSDYEKLYALYEYMTARITYVDPSRGYSMAQMTPYGALVQNKAMSYGFAIAFYRLALEMGIDCRVITGTRNGQAHYWNIVELDGVYYNVDAAIDASHTASGDPWSHFLKCNASFSGYTRDEYFTDPIFTDYFPTSSSDYVTDSGEHVHSYSETVFLPTCTAEGYTLYVCGCGHELKSSYTDMVEHTWQDAEVILAPTNTSDGKVLQVCEVCLAERTQRLRSDALTQALVYERMAELEADYPTGTFYDNSVGYAWNGGIFSMGYGCAGFAFMLSDAAFGELPARMITEDISIDMLRVGDILRVNNDTHSVVVMEIYEDYIVLAEGNMNSATYWGRTMTAQEIIDDTDYVLTRYPEDWSEESYVLGDVDHDGYITAVDAMLVRQYIAQWELATFYRENADMDGDGAIDAQDAMMLRYMIAG